MSTRGGIGRLTSQKPIAFRAVYHHFDSYPTGLGKNLWNLYNNFFKKDLKAMLKVLTKDHNAWSTIQGDFTKEIGYGKDGPQCYCHGDRSEKNKPITEKTASGCGCEWVYAFETVDGEDLMHVLSSYCDPEGKCVGQKMIGMFGCGDEKAVWRDVAIINLNEIEPIWEAIEV
jgi:hypothetical protein